MAVGRVDFCIRHLAPVAHQRLHDLAGALGGKAPVGTERGEEEVGLGPGQRLCQAAVEITRRIEVVERLGDAQIRVRIVVLGELLALVAKVRLDLELGRKREVLAVAQVDLCRFGSYNGRA